MSMAMDKLYFCDLEAELDALGFPQGGERFQALAERQRFGLPPIEDGFDDVRREQRQAEHAADK